MYGNYFTLNCDSQNQKLALKMYSEKPSMSSVELSNCQSVYEDGWYQLMFYCTDYHPQDIDIVTVSVNNNEIGTLHFKEYKDALLGQLVFNSDNQIQGQLFLMQYELVILRFDLYFLDGNHKAFYSDYFLSMSKNESDTENIGRMLKKLATIDSAEIGRWLFPYDDTEQDTGEYTNEFCRNTYTSLATYVQLLTEIACCYKDNYAYFRSLAKHTIVKDTKMQSYRDAKSITIDGVNWIMQNTDQLKKVNVKSGISYHNNNYLPLKMQSEIKLKSYDVYENRVILSFLFTVLLSGRQIFNEFQEDVQREHREYKKVNASLDGNYTVPILAIKSVQIDYFEDLLSQMENKLDALQMMLGEYKSLFAEIPMMQLTSIPQKTKTFQEVQPYSRVYEALMHWLQFGKFRLSKDKLILHAKTLDQIFEYYSIIEILRMFQEHGYMPFNMKVPSYKYEYEVSDGSYDNSSNMANTFILKKDDVVATIYKEPVIGASSFQNNLTLYRTTDYYSGNLHSNYYTPDFVLKFTKNDSDACSEYAILDAKFSSRQSIIRYHLPEIMRKYSYDIAAAEKEVVPKMVWALQGRVRDEETSVWMYHNSLLAKKYKPKISYGIFSLNTIEDDTDALWQVITDNISIDI